MNFNKRISSLEERQPKPSTSWDRENESAKEYVDRYIKEDVSAFRREYEPEECGGLSAEEYIRENLVLPDEK